MECIRWLFSPNTINLELVLAAKTEQQRCPSLCYQLFVLSPVLTQALVVSCTGKLSWAGANLAGKRVCDSRGEEEAGARARLLAGGRAAALGSAASPQRSPRRCSLGFRKFEGLRFPGFELSNLEVNPGDFFLQPLVT